jgi:hypothetical protein
VSDIVIPEEAARDALAAEVLPWLQQCGPCDGGLPMACSHPDGDYRVILAKVWAAYEALEAALPALRRQWAAEVAQAIQASAEAQAIHPAAEVDNAYYRATNHAIAIVREFGESLPIAECEEGE